MAHNVDSLHVGDKMRISTELLKQIAEEPRTHDVVRVVRVVLEDDGTKTLWLERSAEAR
jgi:hypothetical protein